MHVCDYIFLYFSSGFTIPHFESFISTQDISKVYNGEEKCPISMPCQHSSRCSRRALGQWTIINGIKEKVLDFDIMHVFRENFALKYSIGKFNNLPEVLIFKNTKFWPDLGFPTINPSKVFLIDNETLKNEYCGYCPDGRFKTIENCVFLYDYDGVAVPRLLTHDQKEKYISEYYKQVLTTFFPLGKEGKKRTNLARLEIGLETKNPLSMLMGHTFM